MTVMGDVLSTIADRWGFILAGVVLGYALATALSWGKVQEANDVLDRWDAAERERREAFDNGWQAARRALEMETGS